MKVNNRTPTFMGDLRAQVGAAQLGARRLKEVIARHGVAAVRGASQYMIDYAARRFREEVASWPDGVYESDAYVDHDPKGNKDIHIHCKVTVKGDRLTVDFTGSDTRDEPRRLLDLRQHARLRRGADRHDDGPVDPEERGVLRLDRAHRARGLLPQSAAEQVGRRRHASSRHRGRRGDRQGARAGDPRALLPADLQDGHADGDLRHQPAHRAALHRPLRRHLRRLLRRGEGPGRLGRDERQLRQPHPRHRRDQREHLPGAPPGARLRHRHRRRRASGAAVRARSTSSRSSRRRRSTPTSSAASTRCRASPAAAPARRTS